MPIIVIISIKETIHYCQPLWIQKAIYTSEKWWTSLCSGFNLLPILTGIGFFAKNWWDLFWECSPHVPIHSGGPVMYFFWRQFIETGQDLNCGWTYCVQGVEICFYLATLYFSWINTCKYKIEKMLGIRTCTRWYGWNLIAQLMLKIFCTSFDLISKPKKFVKLHVKCVAQK